MTEAPFLLPRSSSPRFTARIVAGRFLHSV